MKRIAITGANGVLGHALIGQLKIDGSFSITKLVRNPKDINEFEFDLRKPFRSNSFFKDFNIDLLVLAAWDMKGRANVKQRPSVTGSIDLCKIAIESGVKIIFISSMSSFEGCVSVYGQQKQEVEKFVLKNAGWVIRPGLIWGWDIKSGIFYKLKNMVCKYPFVPSLVIKSKLHMVEINQLVSVIIQILKNPKDFPPETYTVASSDPVSIEYILNGCAKHYGLKRFYIPIYWGILFFGLKTIELLGLNPPFRSDSLIGLVNSDQNPNLKFKNILINFN